MPTLVSLGVLYDRGDRIAPKDRAEAARWYRLAAKQGYDQAQCILGFMYTRGYGVPEDLVFAHMWWNLSTAQGYWLARVDRDASRGRG